MARKPKVQTRLANDTYDDLTEYRDNRDITEADATRRLIEAGLEAEPLDPGEAVADGGLTEEQYNTLRDELADSRAGLDATRHEMRVLVAGVWVGLLGTLALLIPGPFNLLAAGTAITAVAGTVAYLISRRLHDD